MKNDRLTGIYLRDILMDTEEPITIREMRDKLEKEYFTPVDVTTVQRYIIEMKQGMVGYILRGDRNGYYLQRTNKK